MKAVEALARLEKAGTEHGKSIHKLREAARMIAEKIEQICPIDVELPRGYRVVEVKSNVGDACFLVLGTDYIDGDGCYMHGDFNCFVPASSREGLLQFAKDIASGLLDDLSEFLEQRTEANARHTCSMIVP